MLTPMSTSAHTMNITIEVVEKIDVDDNAHRIAGRLIVGGFIQQPRVSKRTAPRAKPTSKDEIAPVHSGAAIKFGNEADRDRRADVCLNALQIDP